MSLLSAINQKQMSLGLFKSPGSVKHKQTAEFGVHIEKLPAEIIEKILSHLHTSDVLLNLALVSKSMNNISKNPGVHLNVSLYCTALSTSAVSFLEKAKQLREH